MLLVRRRSRELPRRAGSGWKGRIHLPCHMGNHGPQLRTIWGSGSVLVVQDTRSCTRAARRRTGAPGLAQNAATYWVDGRGAQ